tara:strand:- start:246 stop:485 length:240 start_codon:yes stop_codon:yes gene_type:complete
MGFVEKTFFGDYIIIDPQIILTVADSGKMEVNFAPWIPYAKEYKFKIRKPLIQTVFDPKPQLETNFKVATGNRGVRGKK